MQNSTLPSHLRVIVVKRLKMHLQNPWWLNVKDLPNIVLNECGDIEPFTLLDWQQATIPQWVSPYVVPAEVSLWPIAVVPNYQVIAIKDILVRVQAIDDISIARAEYTMDMTMHNMTKA